MNLVIFLRNFDGILSEFHGYSQKMIKCHEILIRSARKMRKKAEKFRNWCQISFVHFIISIVSLVLTDSRGDGAHGGGERGEGEEALQDPRPGEEGRPAKMAAE